LTVFQAFWAPIAVVITSLPLRLPPSTVLCSYHLAGVNLLEKEKYPRRKNEEPMAMVST
jgi:hypothetical protein